jgi:Putative metal-binding motif
MHSRILGAVIAASVFACQGETGVLIEVSRDETVVPNIGRLEFYVGTEPIEGYPARFVDPEPEERVRLEGRDIGEDPYRLMIRPRERRGGGIMVAVVAYRVDEVVGFGALEQPVSFVDGEVVMWRIVLSSELPDGFGVDETGCLSWVDENGDRVAIGQPDDQDCDGWAKDGDDCNDLDPAINPGASESCGNAVDEDCDDQTDENVDEDGDQVTTCDGDCNDGDPSVAPGADEACDGRDNDCNGMCDEGQDGDGDEFTACGSKIVEGGTACLFDPERADCDDGDAEVHPGADEVCDGADNDCDQVCDQSGAGLDRDGDGFTACGSIVDHCGRSDLLADCRDEDGAVHPGAVELCNGVDDDCDGERLQRGPCFALDPEGEGCFFGERDCAEQDGEAGDWEAACQPRDGLLDEVPPELCATYDACDLAIDPPEPDPYVCSIESEDSGLAIARCGLSYQIATGEQCPQSDVVLPSIGVCSWAVVGGIDQADFQVGLRPVDLPDETPQPTLGVCDAVLVVTARASGAPAPHLVILSRTDELGTTVDFVAVALAPEPVEECDAPGLDCQEIVLP